MKRYQFVIMSLLAMMTVCSGCATLVVVMDSGEVDVLDREESQEEGEVQE